MAETTPKSVNESHRRYWAEQRVTLANGLADDPLREAAFELLADELRRHVSAYSQMSIYHALSCAEYMRRRFLEAQARRGGKTKKTDALQELIKDFVQHLPSITVWQLEEKLRARQGTSVIQDIAEGTIWFTNHNGSSKTAPLTGLKDRLFRAKRSICSR
jgi:hypothetical protein